MRLSSTKLVYQLMLKLLTSCLDSHMVEISMGAAPCIEDAILQQTSWSSGSYHLFAPSSSMFCEP